MRKNLPEMIAFYNRTKAGVDTLDQLVGTYIVKEKPIAGHLLCLETLLTSQGNANVPWLEVDPNWNKNGFFRRRMFRGQLGSIRK